MEQDSFTLPEKGSLFLAESVINGTIRSDDDLCLKGEVVGDVHCKANLYVERKAVIKGNVCCERLYLDGMIAGDVRVDKRTHLKAHAVITGSLNTSTLLIHPQAKVEKGLKLHEQ